VPSWSAAEGGRRLHGWRRRRRRFLYLREFAEQRGCAEQGDYGLREGPGLGCYPTDRTSLNSHLAAFSCTRRPKGAAASLTNRPRRGQSQQQHLS